MNGICINKIISDFDNGSQYLVLWVSPDSEHGYWYDLNSSSRKPSKFIFADIFNEANNQKYEISDYLQMDIRTESMFSEAEKMHRDKMWLKIRDAVEYEPEIYESKTRFEILRVIAEEHDISPSNIYPLLDKYWRAGKTKNALIPSFYKRGPKGNVFSDEKKKSGRKAYDTDTAGKVLTEKDHINFASAIKSYYLNRNKTTLSAVYEKLLKDYYGVKNVDGIEQKLLPPNERPSMRQFRYWYSKNRDNVTEQKKRDGESAFELNGRSVLGRSDYGIMGPGAQFQIDATVGDVYLVSQFDRSNIIGRPVLYFIIDVFSRMVTGMSVGLEGPSWVGMAGAIANMAQDKVTYCKNYGIEITESEWPCKHMPAALIGDRGELISKNADNLVNMFGIRIMNAPPYRADLKGIVEQHFRTINTNSVALLPGSVKPDMSKRGGHDYRLDAKLDIRQFTQIIIKCVLHYNNYHYMDYFERSEAMMRDGVKAIPFKLWDWGTINVSGTLRSFSEEQVRFAVMPTDKATVTGKGIRFKGLFYTSDRAENEKWFEKARLKKTWSVTISYDPRDMANIYIWNKEDKTYDTCSLLDWNSKNAGKFMDEIIYEQRKEKIVSNQLKSTEIEAKVNLNDEIETIVAEAQNMGKDLPQKSKTERVSNIKENRRNERKAIQSETKKNETSENDASVTVNTASAPIDDDDMTPNMRMIKQKLEERLKK